MRKNEFWNKFFNKKEKDDGEVSIQLKNGRILKARGAMQDLDDNNKVYFIPAWSVYLWEGPISVKYEEIEKIE